MPPVSRPEIVLDAASELRTFLIADLCDFTRFTEDYGDQAAARLASQFADLADEVAAHWRGRVIELRGDEALAIFVSARDALHAAVDLQTRLSQLSLQDMTFQVRIGLDAGEAVAVRDGYRSGALNRAARLQSVARKGEILASEIVEELARKTPGLALLDRGEVRLKGLSTPAKVFQVVADDQVPQSVPKFSAVSAVPTNLSPQPTQFVGRERDVRAVTELLKREDVRLLTLAGPGGIGKTRLAMRAAEAELSSFTGGVFFVPLASARDVDSVFHGMARALDLSEVQGQPSAAIVKNYLKDRQVLLVLDNLEQVMEVAPYIGDLIATCPKLTVLATSRVVLHVYGEHEYPVPPLSVPDLTAPVRVETLTQYESIRLFLDRVALIQPTFELVEENARSVAEICCRLEGLPLAIELAAARIKMFPPRVLVTRLDKRLNVLTGGPRNLPERQQTLRAAIAWSYDLLDQSEQELFRRLSVFVGGCTLEAAEAVCAVLDSDLNVLDGLSSLVDQSLLQRQEGPGPAGYRESRFQMLETIREFAVEQLEHDSQRDELPRLHALYFHALADKSYDMLMGAGRDPWREMWRAEWGNLRAMLDWCIQSGHPEIGLPVAGFLWVWCWLDGPVEMRAWVDRLLAMPEAQASTSARGWCLGAAAALAWHMGETESVPVLGAMAVKIARDCKDQRLLPGALMLAVTSNHSARALLEEARALYRQQGNVFGHGFAAVAAVRPLTAIGEDALLRTWLKDALADFQRTGDVFGQALVLRALGTLALDAGNLKAARAYLEDALELFRSMHEKRYLPLVLLALGGISLQLQELDRAEDHFIEALTFVQAYADGGNVASCLEGFAALAFDRGQMERSALLGAAAHKVRASDNTVPFPSSSVLSSETTRMLGREIDAATLQRWSSQGYGLSKEEAVAIALAPTSFGEQATDEENDSLAPDSH